MWVNCETGETAKDMTEMYRIEATNKRYYTPSGRINIDCLWDNWALEGNDILDSGASATLFKALQALILDDNAEEAKELFFKAYAEWANYWIDTTCQEVWDWTDNETEVE